MRKFIFFLFSSVIISSVANAQYIYPTADYHSEIKHFELSNFDIQDSVLYLPLGESGLHILNITDLNNIKEIAVYKEYEKRSRKKVYGIANCVKVEGNKAYLSYGPLGLKILNVSDPSMPFPLGKYYRYQDVYCTELYENYAFLGYVGMGLEIVDLSNLDNIKMVSRNNVKDFSVKNIQIIPPYVIISGGDNGLRIFKFQEPFTKFKPSEFPKEYYTDKDINKLLIKGKIAYVANDIDGLTVLNMGLPLYPLKVNNIKTAGKTTDITIDGNYIYVACGKSIEVYDIREPEKPVKTHEYTDKDKKFQSLKINGDYLFASYDGGGKDYGIMIFQIE